MERSKRIILAVAFGFDMVLGLLCLNYCKFEGIERHMEFAAANNIPAPSIAIFYVGAFLAVTGAGGIGFVLGRPSLDSKPTVS